MMRIINQLRRFRFAFITVCITTIILPVNVFAVATLGDIANDINTGPMVGLHHFMNGVCYILGFWFLIMSIKKYQAYKENVSEMPLSTPIVFLLIGLALILFPLFYYLTGVRSVLG